MKVGPAVSRVLSIRVAVVMCALAALLILLGASLPWGEVPVPESFLAATPKAGRAATFPAREVGEAGVPALGLVALAGAGALLAASGATRRLIAALLGVAGLGVAFLVLRFRSGASLAAVDLDAISRRMPLPFGLGDGRLTAGYGTLVALAGAVLLVVGAVLAASAPVGRGLGARFDAPTAAAAPTAPAAAAPTTPADTAADGTDAWNAIDRGEDPTEGFTQR